MPDLPTRLPGALAALVVVLLMAAACANQPIGGEEGTTPTLPDVSVTLPETTQAPEGTEAPETTQAPETTEAPSQPPPEEAAPPADSENAEQDGLDSEDWILLAIIGIAVIALIAWVVSASAKRSHARAAADAERSNRMNSIIGGSRWFHDQASLELLGVTDSSQLESTWAAMRPRVVQTEAEIASQAAADPSQQQSLGALASSVSALRGALDTYVRVRTTPDAQPTLIESSTASVTNARTQLQSSINPVAAAAVA